MGYSPGRQKPNVVSSTGKMAALKVFFSSSTTADGGVGGTEFRKGGRGAGRGEKKGGEEGRKLGGGGGTRDWRLAGSLVHSRWQARCPHNPTQQQYSSCSVPLFLSQVKTWPP